MAQVFKSSNSKYALRLAESLPKDSKDAVAFLCEGFANWQRGQREGGADLSNYGEYLSFYAMLSIHCEPANIVLKQHPTLKGNKSDDIEKIICCFASVRQELAVSTLDLRFLHKIPPVAAHKIETTSEHRYLLKVDEGNALNELVSHLLNLLASANTTGNLHLALLAEQQKNMQGQIQQKFLELDDAWHMLSQISMLLDVLPQDSPDAAQLMRQLTELLWRVQARADKAPKSTFQNMLQKLTNPTKWEAETSLNRI